MVATEEWDPRLWLSNLGSSSSLPVVELAVRGSWGSKPDSSSPVAKPAVWAARTILLSTSTRTRRYEAIRIQLSNLTIDGNSIPQ